jgi:hypothetical protein
MKLPFPMFVVCSFTFGGRLTRSGPWSGALRGPRSALDALGLLRWRRQPLDQGANGPVVRRRDPPRRPPSPPP